MSPKSPGTFEIPNWDEASLKKVHVEDTAAGVATEIGLDERPGDARERHAFHRERQHRHQAPPVAIPTVDEIPTIIVRNGLFAGGKRIRTCMGLFLSSGRLWLFVGSLFGAGKPFFVPSPAIRFAERAEGVKGPKR